MTVVALGSGDYHRFVGRLPHFKLVNMFIETDPSNSVDGSVRLQRAGLALLRDLALPAPVRLVWRQPGAFNGDFFVAASNKLSRLTKAGAFTPVADITGGTSLLKMASRPTDALILEDGLLRIYDGATLTPVVMPDGYSNVSSIAVIDQFYLIGIANTGRFYWIIPGEVTVDPLDFATAERQTDNLRAIATLGDEIWMLGTDGEEVWTTTGDQLDPFQRTPGRAYNMGCINGDSVIQFRNALYWISPNNEVVAASGVPRAISDYGASEILRASDATKIRAWQYSVDQHHFYVVTTDIKTFVFDVAGDELPPNVTLMMGNAKPTPMSIFSSYGLNTWRAHTGAQDGAYIVCGDSESSKLYLLDLARSNDNGDPLVREISGAIENVGREAACNSFSVRVAVGWEAQPGFEPQLEIRWSDDEANTWSAYRQIGLGKQGQYNKDVVLRSLGTIGRPGRVFELRMTDDAVFRINHAHVNEDDDVQAPQQ